MCKNKSTIKTHNLDYFDLYHFTTSIETNIETNYLNLFNNNNIQNAKPEIFVQCTTLSLAWCDALI